MPPEQVAPSTPLRGNTKFAATYLAVSTSMLEKLRVFGGGPHFHKVGSRVVYDRHDLDGWLATRKRRSTSDLATNLVENA